MHPPPLVAGTDLLHSLVVFPSEVPTSAFTRKSPAITPLLPLLTQLLAHLLPPTFLLHLCVDPLSLPHPSQEASYFIDVLCSLRYSCCRWRPHAAPDLILSASARSSSNSLAVTVRSSATLGVTLTLSANCHSPLLHFTGKEKKRPGGTP